MENSEITLSSFTQQPQIQTPKGMILAGGSGSRLQPMTRVISKQLLPIYNKPMVYYPLTTLMHAGVRDVLIITNPQDIEDFHRLLEDGSQWGMSISYTIQKKARGLPEAYTLGSSFLGKSPSILILGDNIYYGNGLGLLLRKAVQGLRGACGITSSVRDPSRYGVVTFDDETGLPIKLEEKPKNPESNWAVTGIYFCDKEAPHIARNLKPSARGELEIMDLFNEYLKTNRLDMLRMSRGLAWFDAGTHDSLLEASEFVATIEKRQGLMIASPEETAFRMGFIGPEDLERLIHGFQPSAYRTYLEHVLHESQPKKVLKKKIA